MKHLSTGISVSITDYLINKAGNQVYLSPETYLFPFSDAYLTVIEQHLKATKTEGRTSQKCIILNVSCMDEIWLEINLIIFYASIFLAIIL